MSKKKNESKEVIRDIIETEVETINLDYNNSIYTCAISSSSIGCKEGEVTVYITCTELGKIFSFITDQVTFDQIIENGSFVLPKIDSEIKEVEKKVEEVSE